MTKRYVIIPVEDIVGEMLEVCLQDDVSKLRKNIAEDEAVLKYDSSKPAILDAYTDVSAAEARAFLNDPENGWIIE